MKQKCTFVLLGLISIIVLGVPSLVAGADYTPKPRPVSEIYSWYIQDFKSEIIVNEDSSLLITEKILADCGDLPDKHGIFRILPTQINLENGKSIKTPVKLLGITDANGNPYSYSESYDWVTHTVTWKIGDADITVSGENYYEIQYEVQNAVRTENPDFDELYWNLNGNFWDLEIDHYSAEIRLPQEVSENNTEIYYYTGYVGSTGDTSLADYSWAHEHTIVFESTNPLAAGEGITVSIAMPKIFTPHTFSFLELYWEYLFLIIPLGAFFLCYKLWRKYGDDPEVDKSIIPEYDPPGGLTPMQIGLLRSNGMFKNSFISASIVSLAVKRHITITDISKTGFLKWLTPKDFRLTKTEDSVKKLPLGKAEQELLNRIMGSSNTITLSSLKDSFYQDIPKIKAVAIKDLDDQSLIVKRGLDLQIAFFIFSGIFLFFCGFGFIFSAFAGLAAIVTGIIFLGFAFIMPKRTVKGSELYWQTKGFQMFMKTAEQHRMQFSERENIFETLLPYAMIFGMTKLWIKKMKMIYGRDYFESYHPAWFMGAYMGSFDANSFNSTISSISSSIASNVSSPSGSGGGGFSGGGGGGGGGGGW